MVLHPLDVEEAAQLRVTLDERLRLGRELIQPDVSFQVENGDTLFVGFGLQKVHHGIPVLRQVAGVRRQATPLFLGVPAA
jgi:hypothetical protein